METLLEDVQGSQAYNNYENEQTCSTRMAVRGGLAMYAGVPAVALFVDTNVLHGNRLGMQHGLIHVTMHASIHVTCTYLSLNFAMPKSHTLALPELSRRTLDDFRSLRNGTN